MQTAALRAVLSAVDNMSPVLKKINITAAFTRKGLMDLSKSTSHLMDTVGKPLALLSGGVGIAGLLAGTNGIIGVSSQFEDFTATLETLMGSSEKAKQSMNWIKDFAKTTPFVLADTTAAFVTLRTFGLDPTKGALKATGDIASLFNKPLEEATNALASAMRGNTEMLDNFGIQGKIIGDKMRMVWDQKGKPFGTYVSKDDNKAIAAAVTAIWERIAGGNMEKKALRWNGIMSDLSDSWTNFLRTIGDAGSFEYAEKHIKALLNQTEKLDKSGKLQQWANKISGLLVGTFSRLERWITSFDPDKFLKGLDKMTIKIHKLTDTVGGAENLMLVFLGLFSASTIASLFEIAGGFINVAAGIGKMAWAISGLMLANPVLTLISAAILGIGYAGYKIWQNWDTISAGIKSLWESLGKGWTDFTAGLMQEWTDTKDAAKAIWDAIGDGLSAIWNAPRKLGEEFFTWIDSKFQSLLGIADRFNFSGLFGGSFTNLTDQSSKVGKMAILPPKIMEMADKYSGHYGIPPELLRRLIKQESGGNPNAVSNKGAMGLMQLMPATAKQYGVRDPFDAEQNIAGGTKYLDYLLTRYGGNQAKALAAYNAGEGNVDKYGGMPPFRETQDYVDKILGASRQNISGDISVRFENAPNGMRIDPPRTNGPLSITPDVGYRSFATGLP